MSAGIVTHWKLVYRDGATKEFAACEKLETDELYFFILADDPSVAIEVLKADLVVCERIGGIF